MMIEELKDCVRKPLAERSSFEKNIIELILYLVRNSLSFASFSNSDENKIVLANIFDLYLKPVGVFNACVYLSQEFTADTKNLCYLFLEIFHLVTKRINLDQIFSESNAEMIFRNIIEHKKESLLQRRKQHSSRHSNFGAMYEVRQNGAPVKLLSNPNTKPSGMNLYSNKGIRNKIQKPKTRSQVPNKNTEIDHASSSIMFPLEMLGKIKSMLMDLLEHSYGTLVEANHQEFYSQDNVNYRYDESKIFLDFLCFGIRAAHC